MAMAFEAGTYDFVFTKCVQRLFVRLMLSY